MNTYKELEKTIRGFKYPESFMKVIELKLIDYDGWSIMDCTEAIERMEGLKTRYPKRRLIPFARRYDCDDIACFEKEYGERVFIVHDFASDGYERGQEYPSFWFWFRNAIEEMIMIDEDEKNGF